MGVSYSAKDETIDRLIETNKTLRDEIIHLKIEAKAKNENNLKLAEKVKEQEGKIRTLEAELDKAIDNSIKLTPFEAAFYVHYLAANAKLLREAEVGFSDGRSYKYSEVLKKIAYMLLSLDGEKCS